MAGQEEKPSRRQTKSRTNSPVFDQQPSEVLARKQSVDLAAMSEMMRAFSESISSNIDSKFVTFQKDIQTSLEKMDQRLQNTMTAIEHNKTAIQKVDEKLAHFQASVKQVEQEVTQTKNIAQRLRSDVTDQETRLKRVETSQQDANLQLLLVELRQKETHLRVRGAPPTEQGDIRDWLIQKMSTFWDKEADELSSWIQSIYRFGTGRPNKNKKFTPDCMIIFKTREFRDKVLAWHYEKRLIIEGQQIILFKEVPKGMLTIRAEFKKLTTALQRNSIQYRWLTPKGLEFTYGLKKVKILSIQEMDAFLEKHKDLMSVRKLSTELKSGLEPKDKADPEEEKSEEEL